MITMDARLRRRDRQTDRRTWSRQYRDDSSERIAR